VGRVGYYRNVIFLPCLVSLCSIASRISSGVINERDEINYTFVVVTG
jgi:hypothetical protein